MHKFCNASNTKSIILFILESRIHLLLLGIIHLHTSHNSPIIFWPLSYPVMEIGVDMCEWLDLKKSLQRIQSWDTEVLRQWHASMVGVFDFGLLAHLAWASGSSKNEYQYCWGSPVSRYRTASTVLMLVTPRGPCHLGAWQVTVVDRLMLKSKVADLWFEGYLLRSL